MKLEFCTNNLNQYYDDTMLDILEDLVDELGLQVREMDCLSYCDECTCSPYVLMNSTFIEAQSPEDLLKKIKDNAS